MMVGKATPRDAVEVRSLHLFLAEHRLASRQTRSTSFSAPHHSSSPPEPNKELGSESCTS